MRSLRWTALALVGACACCSSLPLSAAPVVQVALDQPGPAIPSTLVGVFFEDINYGADGGLSAERVLNRGFEFPQPLAGWRAAGALTAEILDREPVSSHGPHFVHLAAGPAGGILENSGFRGMGVERGKDYWLTLVLRAAAREGVVLRAQLVGDDGRVLASKRIKVAKPQWRRVSVPLRARDTEPRARLQLKLESAGAIDLDQVSLMPEESLKGRLPRFRRDLVRMLRDLHPGFLRFPGGCIVEGRHLPLRYQWKNTLGDRDERPLLINRWNDEFKHRPAPEYFQTFDIGFHEYFLLSEAIGAAPLPILNCGMACQFNSGELVPLAELEPYIQDALDLIEYANGPVTSIWGGRRAAAGHPKPFNLRYLGVGNEQWGPQYLERFERFAKAIKQRYPEVRLVGSAGPGPADDWFKLAWSRLPGLGADIMDEHCYAAPGWFFENAGRFDGYDRRGPKVFMGEYAAQSVGVAKPENRNTWGCALAEAAFLTGLERNADVVEMSSYAPLFGHLDAWQWTPNLIWFDNLGVFGTPSYQVQRLFGRHRGARTVPATLEGAAIKGRDGLYVSASVDARGHEVILKIVNARPESRVVQFDFGAGVRLGHKAEITELSSVDLNAENTMAAPRRVFPAQRTEDLQGASWTPTLLPSSLTVVRLPYRQRE